MALEAAVRLLRIAFQPLHPGDLETAGRAQDGVGLGVLRPAPVAELEIEFRAGMTAGAGQDTGEPVETGCSGARGRLLELNLRFRGGMRQSQPGGLEVERFFLQHRHVRTLRAMAQETVLLLRHLQAIGHSLGPVLHGFLRRVFAARAVTRFALKTVLDMKTLGAFPDLFFRGGGMTAEAHPRLVRLFGDAAEAGDFLGVGQ
jgi:hypothetical protein